MIIPERDGRGRMVYYEANGSGTIGDPAYKIVSSKNTGAQKEIFSLQMDTVGDGSGTTNQNVDGSVTSVIFKIAPPAGEVWRVSRLIIYIRDAGTFDSGGWGNNAGIPLVNGMQFHRVQNSVSLAIGSAVKSHGDLAALCHDVTKISWGAGDEFLTARWTFTKAGQYIRLVGDDNDELHVDIADNLTHLVEQIVTVQGYKE